MKLAYHVTVPAPANPRVDALFQEIAQLRAHFRGSLTQWYPFRRGGLVHGRRWYGMHRLWRLRALDSAVDVHHVFAGDAFAYAALGVLRKPVIYTIVAGIRPECVQHTARLARVIGMVNGPAQASLAAGYGFARVLQSQPGLPQRNRPVCSPPTGAFHLISASAPWNLAQFEPRGMQLLLSAVQRMPDVRLTLVWRGDTAQAMRNLIAASNLTARVTVLEGIIDVHTLLDSVHAAVVLAAQPALIKSYPTSLMEAVQAARPVLVSQCIPLAADATAVGYGVAVPAHDADALLHSLQQLRDGYARYQHAAHECSGRHFQLQHLLQSHATAYAIACETGSPR